MKLAAAGAPVVVVVNMDRPAILTEFIDKAAAVLASFGSSDRAVMDVVSGKACPAGKFPFNLPFDMTSVMSQAEDLPHDIADPLFRFGFGLSYRGAAGSR